MTSIEEYEDILLDKKYLKVGNRNPPISDDLLIRCLKEVFLGKINTEESDDYENSYLLSLILSEKSLDFRNWNANVYNKEFYKSFNVKEFYKEHPDLISEF